MSKHIISANMSSSKVAPGVSREIERQAHLEQWAEATLDCYRFPTDRATAKLEGYNGRFPANDVLVEMGADLVALATAFENGLTVRAFRKALRGRKLNLDTFSKAVNAGLDVQAFSDAVMLGMNVPFFCEAVYNGLGVEHFGDTLGNFEDMRALNGAFENFCDNAEDVRSFPNATERALVLAGRREEAEALAAC
jgi:hypothetical protein